MLSLRVVSSCQVIRILLLTVFIINVLCLKLIMKKLFDYFALVFSVISVHSHPKLYCSVFISFNSSWSILYLVSYFNALCPNRELVNVEYFLYLRSQRVLGRLHLKNTESEFTEGGHANSRGPNAILIIFVHIFHNSKFLKCWPIWEFYIFCWLFQRNYNEKNDVLINVFSF